MVHMTNPLKVLNVGGGRGRELPPEYNGWQQSLLDIDPLVNPDICCDARELITQLPDAYDAIYCSHNLEHYFQHDVPTVLTGFRHILKPGGFVHIRVPNITSLMQHMLKNNLDINDVWYRAGMLPITFHDVMFGWSREVETGNEFYCHKTAFTLLSLSTVLESNGFRDITLGETGLEIMAKGYK